MSWFVSCEAGVSQTRTKGSFVKRRMQRRKSLVMPVAIDTSVLIASEKKGDFESILPDDDGPYYIPAHAAAEFLVGTHPPVRAELRERATRLYHTRFKSIVSGFVETDAARLALLKFFDAGIAATVLARGDKLLVIDEDFDRLKDQITLLRPKSE